MAKHDMLRLETNFKQRQLLRVHVVPQTVCQRQNPQYTLVGFTHSLPLLTTKTHTRMGQIILRPQVVLQFGLLDGHT